MLPLPYRSPIDPRAFVERSTNDRLRHAREDHAVCLRLAASYRIRIARGEPGQREQHAWALGHARTLRARFAELSAPRAPR